MMLGKKKILTKQNVENAFKSLDRVNEVFLLITIQDKSNSLTYNELELVMGSEAAAKIFKKTDSFDLASFRVFCGVE